MNVGTKFKIIHNLEDHIGYVEGTELTIKSIEPNNYVIAVEGNWYIGMEETDIVDNYSDDEIEQFLSNYGIEVEENEPDHYVELMMDNHKCVQWKGKQYYISGSDLFDDEEEIYDILAYKFHV